MEQWNGYKCVTFNFEGYEAIIVFPSENPMASWHLKPYTGTHFRTWK
jgi:hypothetical protein